MNTASFGAKFACNYGDLGRLQVGDVISIPFKDKRDTYWGIVVEPWDKSSGRMPQMIMVQQRLEGELIDPSLTKWVISNLDQKKKMGIFSVPACALYFETYNLDINDLKKPLKPGEAIMLEGFRPNNDYVAEIVARYRSLKQVDNIITFDFERRKVPPQAEEDKGLLTDEVAARRQVVLLYLARQREADRPKQREERLKEQKERAAGLLNGFVVEHPNKREMVKYDIELRSLRTYFNQQAANTTDAEEQQRLTALKEHVRFEMERARAQRYPDRIHTLAQLVRAYNGPASQGYDVNAADIDARLEGRQKLLDFVEHYTSEVQEQKRQIRGAYMIEKDGREKSIVIPLVSKSGGGSKGGRRGGGAQPRR